MGCIGEVLVWCGYYGFGMCVLYYSYSLKFYVEECYVVSYCFFDVLFEEFDFVCLILLLIVVIEGLIGVVQFVWMCLQVIFINIFCGWVVDEVVLIEVLVQWWICVVGFDVFECELLFFDLLLLCLLNVVVILYIGLVIEEICEVMVCCVVDNLLVVFVGEWLLNLVNFLVWV